MALPLLPGERVEARLRPSPWSRLPLYAKAALPILWGALLQLLLASDAWTQHDAGPPWQFWEYLWGNAVVAHLLAALGLTAIGLLAVAGTHWSWRQGLSTGAIAGIIVAGAAAAWWWHTYAWALPAAVAVTALPLMALVETDRGLRSIVFTNLRVRVAGGLWDAQEGHARYEDIADIDVEQDALGRLVDVGTLHPVAAAHARDEPMPRIEGIRPLSQGRELLAAMVQHATASPELKRAGDTEARLYQALRAFGHAPPVPREEPGAA